MRSHISRHLGLILVFACPLPAVLGQVHSHLPHAPVDAETVRMHQAFAEADYIANNTQGFSSFSAHGTFGLNSPWHGMPWGIYQLVWRPTTANNSWTGPMPLFVPTYPMIYDSDTPRPVDPSVSLARPAWLKPDTTPRLPVPIMSKRRTFSPAAKAKADEYIADGDAQFAKQKYTSAVQRYQAAARVAPDLADPYFRQGFALIARGDYRGAVNAFRMGLKLRSEWNNCDFRLDTIYAGGALDKANQRLAQRMSKDPLDPDLLLAMGMQLFFDGQRNRSAIYLSQAAQLNAIDPRLLDNFLSHAEQPPPVSTDP